MRVAVVFHKNPFVAPTGIDLVRLRAIASGLISKGIETEVIAPVQHSGMIDGNIPVYGLNHFAKSGPYDIVKTCYHDSIKLVPAKNKNIVSRIVRVVDSTFPERDSLFRTKLLDCQKLISDRAALVIFNNQENRSRWIKFYGGVVQTALVPTGCPLVIPPPVRNPYHTHKKVLLFLGSIAAGRILHMLNQLAEHVTDVAEIHLVGLNKACMYGNDFGLELSSLIVNHGQKPEHEIWDYIYNADAGLAFATGPQPFDNDMSKIYSYLRGGLPTLSEEPILNNELVLGLEYGSVFGYGDLAALISRCRDLLINPPIEKRDHVMGRMAADHSWDRRVDQYIELFNQLVGHGF